MKLRSQLFFITSALFAAFMVVAWLYSQHLVTQVNEQWASRLTEKQVQYDTHRTLQPLLQEISLTKKLAAEPDVVAMAVDEANDSVRNQALIVMEQYRSLFSSHAYFFALVKSGHYYFNDRANSYGNSQLRYTLQLGNTNDAWFYSTVASKSECQINVDPDAHLGGTRVWVNVQVKKNNQVVAIIGTGIEISEFIQDSVGITMADTYNLFVDRDMAVQLNADMTLIDYSSITKSVEQRRKVDVLITEPNDLAHLRVVMRQLEKSPKEIKTLWVNFSGKKMLLGVAYLPEIGWFDLTLIDENSLHLLNQFDFVPFLAIMILLGLAILGIVFHRLVLKPLSQIENSIQQVQNGHFDRDVPVVGTAEIAQLSMHFKSMVETLRKHHSELKDQVADRTKQLLLELEERKRTEVALRDNEERLHLALSAANQGWFYCNLQSGQVFLSAEFIKILGYDVQNYLSSLDAWEESLHPNDRETTLLGYQECVATGGPITLQYRRRKANGEWLWVRSVGKITEWDEQHQPLKMVGIHTDITEQQQTLEQLRSVAIELEVANLQIESERASLAVRVAERTAQLEYVNKAKDSFLATMSHEIRTPLGGMLGMMGLLKLTSLNLQQQHQLEIAHHSGQNLLRIVNDILDWSKIEAGKLELDTHNASIVEMLNLVVSSHEQQALDKGINLKVTIDSQLSAEHIFDSLRLMQILNNLTSNAIKFTQQGGVEISAQRQGICDGYEAVRFSVKDSGRGIDEEQQSRIFQYYEQATSDTARMYGGTGLGLAICRRLAGLMDGTLSVESTLGLGTTFHFDISLPAVNIIHPKSSAKLGEATEPIIQQNTQLRIDGRPLHVLIVDDHPVNRMVLKLQLGTLGVNVEVADSGTPALKLFHSTQFDLIITDCHMPEMDGYELSRRIRDIEHQAGSIRIPIIAWTANVMADELERCQLASMDAMLTKPTELSDLRGMLLRWVSRN